MTEEEFDNTTFRKGDKIEIRHYFKTEVEDVEYVNITDRWINNYKPQQISKYIPHAEKKTGRRRHSTQAHERP